MKLEIVFVEHLTEVQKRAYIIADNRLALNAGWDAEMLSVELADLQGADFDISLLGFDDAELNKLLGGMEDVKDDDFDVDAELQKPAITKTGDLWLLGKHRLVCGDSTKPETYALLQKTYTVDFLSKKMKNNEGEVPQYYVQNSHPASIDPDEFDAVQVEIERRKQLGRPCACNSPLSTKLVCGDCGGFYGSKVWGSNTKYRRTIWRCNNKYKGDTKCTTPHVTENNVMQGFIEAFNKLMIDRDGIIADCRLAQSVLCDCSGIDSEMKELQQEIEVVTELSKKAICENASIVVDQQEWSERNSGYMERYEKATERVAELETMKQGKQSKFLILDSFIKEIQTRPNVIDEFDVQLWTVTVDKVTVMPEGRMVLRFKDGSEF